MLDSKGFDLWANGYDRSVKLYENEDKYPFAGYKSVLGSIYSSICCGAGRRILDVGFGTGVLSARLYAGGYSISGVDFSPKMLELAKSKMPEAELLLCDFTKGLPETISAKKFDFIICTYALHHIGENKQAEFIRTLLSLLSDSGRLFIGDVMFMTAADRDACRAQSGDSWDSDEIYPIVGSLADEFPDMRFTGISYCAGVLEFSINSKKSL